MAVTMKQFILLIALLLAGCSDRTYKPASRKVTRHYSAAICRTSHAGYMALGFCSRCGGRTSSITMSHCYKCEESTGRCSFCRKRKSWNRSNSTQEDLEALFGMLRSVNPKDRKQAARAIVSIGEPAALEDLLSHRYNRAIRTEWAEAAGIAGDERHVPRLTALMQINPFLRFWRWLPFNRIRLYTGPSQQETAATALAKIDTESAREALRRQIYKGHAQERGEAIPAIAHSPSPEMKRVLAPLLKQLTEEDKLNEDSRKGLILTTLRTMTNCDDTALLEAVEFLRRTELPRHEVFSQLPTAPFLERPELITDPIVNILIEDTEKEQITEAHEILLHLINPEKGSAAYQSLAQLLDSDYLLTTRLARELSRKLDISLRIEREDKFRGKRKGAQKLYRVETPEKSQL